jgi:hypothetical protein
MTITKMTDNTEQKDTIVRGMFGPGYRKFLSPEQLKAHREAEARGEVADVIDLKARPPKPRRST